MEDGSVCRFLLNARPLLSVGILTADILALGKEISRLERSGVKLLHIDVMDGRFCPMMTMGPPLIKALTTSLFKDIHLMIDEPMDKVVDYVSAGADMITIHPESCRHAHRLLQWIGTLTNINDARRGIARGVALNPGTPLSILNPLFDEIDFILLLAVNPGWKGQAFIPATMSRIAEVQRLIAHSGKEILLGVDGGITRENVHAVAKIGVDLIISGSAVFDGGSVEANCVSMLQSITAAVGA